MTSFRVALAFEAFGARIGVEAPEADASRVRPRLPPTAESIDPENLDATFRIVPAPSNALSEKPLYTLTCTEGTVADPTYRGSLEDICEELELDLHFHVAVAARGWLFVHAGVVEWDGAAIVMPGRSLAGKSSLVLALVEAGATYFSDEYAVFDERGRVYPYPKPLTQRRQGRLPVLHTPEALGQPTVCPVPLGRAVVTRYREGETWEPVRMTAADVMMALFANTVSQRMAPEHALDWLSRAVDNVEGLEGLRGEAADVAAVLLDGDAHATRAC